MTTDDSRPWNDPGWFIDALLRPDPDRALGDIGMEPATAPHHRVLITVATRVAVSPSLPLHVRVAWGRYAYSASHRLCHPASEAFIQAANAYAAVLAEHHLLDDAIAVQEYILATCEQDRSVSRGMTTRRELARLLHTAGRCEDAETHLNAAYQNRWGLQASSINRASGAMISIEHAAVLAGCDRHDAALELLRERHIEFTDPRPAWRELHAVRACSAVQAAIDTHPPVCTRPRTSTLDGQPLPVAELVEQYRHTIMSVGDGTTVGTDTRSRLRAAVLGRVRSLRRIR